MGVGYDSGGERWCGVSVLEDAIGRLDPDVSPQYLYRGAGSTADVEADLRLLVAAVRERDALAAVIEEALHYNWRGDNWDERDVRIILSRTPSDALVERDARIRAEVIDWIESRAVDRYDLNLVADARARFGLTKGASDGEQ